MFLDSAKVEPVGLTLLPDPFQALAHGLGG